SYSERLPGMFKRRWLVLAVFAFALLLTAYLFKTTPTGFIPTEDQGYFITLVQAPQGTSLAGERKIAIKAETIMRAQPGVVDVFDIGGFSFSGSSPNGGLMFTLLKPWNERTTF